MVTHVKVLAILRIVSGCLGMLIGVGLLLFFGGLAAFVGASERGHDAFVGMSVLGGLGGFLFLLLLALSLPSLIAGIGLLGYRNWARVLCIIVSALDLLSFPIGTALGVYGLWVLLKPEAEELFKEGAVRPQTV